MEMEKLSNVCLREEYARSLGESTNSTIKLGDVDKQLDSKQIELPILSSKWESKAIVVGNGRE